MFYVFLNLSSSRVMKLASLFFATGMLLALAPSTSLAQRTRAMPAGDDNQPTFKEFKGVRIGMSAEEARKKLGNPRDKSDEQDFYVFNDTQAVQIYYDKDKAVNAISIDYMDGASEIPSCKDVLGTEADKKADGSMYKMMRYPKAGYWVSYSRTAGNTPTITITMQKISR
jgi:hypothetical protein